MNNERNYTIGAEDIVAVDVHFENQIEKLIHDILSVDVGESFAISIYDLVNLMLHPTKEDYLKLYKIAAYKLLTRLKHVDIDRARNLVWVCDEARCVVYFGMKDSHGFFELKDL